jgi:hypothetical protein
MIKGNWAREERNRLIKIQKAQGKIERVALLAEEQAELDAKLKEEGDIIAQKKAVQDKKEERMREKMALVQKKKLEKLAMSLAGNTSLLGDCKRS